MRVFIANFGVENYEWPECHSRGTIAAMNEVEAQAYWRTGDREGYITYEMSGKTKRGLTPTKAVASRWYNRMTIVSETSGDLWLHRDKNDLWWTISKAAPPAFEQRTESIPPRKEVIVCHKPCEPWSNENRHGIRLIWTGLHTKARDFLTTEATLQQLSEDYADYARALVDGDDLSPWHSRAIWKARQNSRGGHGVVKSYSPEEMAVVRMARTALGTTEFSNGQQIRGTVKNKNFMFPSQQDSEKYIAELIRNQEHLCAITALPLQFDGDYDDRNMLCSLDRIDSNGHYEPGNLQVVCQFINKWKGASDDAEFRRLLKIVRSVAII